ncbi:19383_t:CDS:1, partial [Racocetra persica]
YHWLATIISEIEYVYKVEEYHQEIIKIINDIILVHIVQIDSIIPNGAYQLLKNILLVLIPKLPYGLSPILYLGDVIHVKLSENGNKLVIS